MFYLDLTNIIAESLFQLWEEKIGEEKIEDIPFTDFEVLESKPLNLEP